jgi:hypothetical protein
MGDMMMRWLKLSLVALVACGFIGMVIYALWMRDEIRTAQVEPALISPPDTALKRRPDEPGGMVIPNRDKMVFDLLDEASTGVSAPAPAPVAGQVAQLPLEGAATPTEVITATAPQANNSPTVTIPPVKTAASSKAPPQAAAPAPVVAETKLNPQPIAQAQPVEQPHAQPVAQAAPAAEPAPKTEAKPATGGSYGVQLAAVGSQADAQKAGARLQAQYPALKGLRLATPAAGNGHWRVQFFGLANSAAAKKVCAALGSKQPCFPVAGK